MAQKIIAALTVVTVLFVCVFAACSKDDGVYAGKGEINYVTDENGEKVLNENGELVVYATDKNGKRVKNDDGEYETLLQQFQPIEEDGIVEDYGFKFAIPKGWKTTSTFGEFVNSDETQSVQISIVKYTYTDYYNFNKNVYEQFLANEEVEANVTWEDDVDLGSDFNGACRFTLSTDEVSSVMYFFENSGNIYKVLFNTSSPDTAVADSLTICKALSFKPYTYYTDVTSASTTAQDSTQAQ